MFKPVCLQIVFPTVCIVEDSYTSIQAVFCRLILLHTGCILED